MSKSNVAVAGKKDVILLPVADLKMSFDVRREMNEDRVLFFKELYEANGDVPPIEVIGGTMNIHDGRHRKAALDQIGRKHAECIYVEQMEFTEQLMDAFGKNVSDSPFPPTRADVVFVMKQLLDAGVSNARLKANFEAYYRPSQVRKMMSDAHSSVAKAKMSKAKLAVAHGGLTVKAAAEEHGVEPERLKEEISGVKRRRKATSVADIKSEISNRHRGNSQRTVSVFRDILEKFEDGEMTEKSVLEVFLHVQRLNAGAAKGVNGWLERFEVLKNATGTKT